MNLLAALKNAISRIKLNNNGKLMTVSATLLPVLIGVAGCKLGKTGQESVRSTSTAVNSTATTSKPGSVLLGSDIEIPANEPTDNADGKPISSPGITSTPAPQLPILTPMIVVGADAGAGPHVKLFAVNPLREAFSHFVFEEGFRGGVRVAAADLDGDGSGEIVVGGGDGSNMVKIFKVHRDALQEINSFKPFGELTSGVYVAACELGGQPAVVVSAGEGAPPHVKAFRTNDLTKPFLSFYAFDQKFLGGVRIACAKNFIVAGAGPGVAPKVATFDESGVLINSFLAFDDGFRGGVYVGVKKVSTGDEALRYGVVVGAGAGATPQVAIFDGPRKISTLFAYEEEFRGGVRVAALDLKAGGKGDEIDNILAGAGPGAGPHALGIDTATLQGNPSFFGFNPGFRGGIFVAGTTFKADAAIGGRNHKGFVVTKVKITPEGQHASSPACPDGAPADEGSFADCGGGRCSGNQRLCLNFVENDFVKPSDNVLVDLYVTPENGSRTAVTCPAGYESAGTAQNCNNGTCLGQQTFCALYQPRSALVSRGKFIAAAGFRLTSKPAIGGGGCRTGYEQKGSVADCRFGKCFGNQPLCVASQSGL